MTTRVAKQLTSKNLLNLAQESGQSEDIKTMLCVFCLIVNGFRREDYMFDHTMFDQVGTVQNFLRTNNRSIPPELLSIA